MNQAERRLERREFASNLAQVLRQRRWIISSNQQTSAFQKEQFPQADSHSLELQRSVVTLHPGIIEKEQLHPSEDGQYHWSINEYLGMLDRIAADMTMQLSYTIDPTSKQQIVEDHRGRRIADFVRRKVEKEPITQSEHVRVAYLAIPQLFKDLTENRNVDPKRLLPWLVMWDEYIAKHVKQFGNVVTPIRVRAPVKVKEYDMQYTYKTLIVTRHTRKLTQTAIKVFLEELRQADPEEYKAMVSQLAIYRKRIQREGLEILGIFDLQHLYSLPQIVNISPRGRNF